jgi:hypothetical protein
MVSLILSGYNATGLHAVGHPQFPILVYNFADPPFRVRGSCFLSRDSPANVLRIES